MSNLAAIVSSITCIRASSPKGMAQPPWVNPFLGSSAGPLHDAIHGDLGDRDDLSHDFSPVLAVRIPTTNHRRFFRHNPTNISIGLEGSLPKTTNVAPALPLLPPSAAQTSSFASGVSIAPAAPHLTQ